MTLYTYNLNGILNTATAIIVPKNTQNVYQDTLLYEYQLYDNIYVSVYSCNIPHDFLMKSKKLPFLYLTVNYKKSLLKFKLFSLIVYFTVTSSIGTEQELINNTIGGVYSIEFVLNTTNSTDTATNINKITPGTSLDYENVFLGNDMIIEYLKCFVADPNLKTLIDSIVLDTIAEKKKNISDPFANLNINSNFRQLNM